MISCKLFWHNCVVTISSMSSLFYICQMVSEQQSDVLVCQQENYFFWVEKNWGLCFLSPGFLALSATYLRMLWWCIILVVLAARKKCLTPAGMPTHCQDLGYYNKLLYCNVSKKIPIVSMLFPPKSHTHIHTHTNEQNPFSWSHGWSLNDFKPVFRELHPWSVIALISPSQWCHN